MKIPTLKPRIQLHNKMIAPVMQSGGWRHSEQTSADRGYGYKWRKAREVFLREHPLCVYCQREGRIEPATVVDHIEPHRGNDRLFWDRGNWQPLCKRCHDTTKKKEEEKNLIESTGWGG